MISLWAGRSCVRILLEVGGLSVLQNAQTVLETHPASHSVCTEVVSRRLSGRDVKLTIHLHLVPRLRMGGTIPLFLLCVFMAWTGRTVLFFSLFAFHLLEV